MLIELYGLPGSGKTTLARKIANNFAWEIIKIRRKRELIFYNLLFLIKHPVRFFALLFYVAVNSSGGRVFYYKLMNTFLDYNAKYQKARRRPNAILDQGYWQNIVAVFDKPLSSEALIRYAKFLLRPDKLIILDTDADKRKERIRERGFFARENFSASYKKKWQEAVEHNDQVLKRNLGNIGVDYLVVKDDSRAAEVCQRLKNRPLKILIISYDWRNIFENDFEELWQKLERDRLKPGFNYFFRISWSTKTYYKKRDDMAALYFKAIFTRNRAVYDFLTFVLSFTLIPLILIKKNFKPDIVLVYEFPFIFSGLFARFFWRSKIVLFLGALPSDLVQTRKFAIIKLWYQRFAETIGKHFVDCCLVITEAIGKYAADLGIDKGKIKSVVINTITRDRDLIASSTRGKVRKLYNIADDQKILLSVGRLEPEKGFGNLLEAFKDLGRSDLILLIVGNGILDYELKNKAKQLGLGRRVTFAGQVSRKEIWNYYQDADIFILLSRSEGLGIVFWEAMYMGVPVIGSRVGGLMDTIGVNEERGFFWPKGDSIARLDAIISKCINRSQDVEIKRKRARLFVQEKIKSGYSINDYL